jgi:hypothetical protein
MLFPRRRIARLLKLKGDALTAWYVAEFTRLNHLKP